MPNAPLPQARPPAPVARALAQPPFLPMTRQEMDALGWEQLDILLVTGDAYVDHPSFGAASLGRWLVHHGFRTGIAAQPRWDEASDVARMGRPRLFAGVTAGSLDSMLAHYTAFRKKRSDDAYTPGGQAGARPNRAAIVYANLVRRAFAGLPVVLGGIEASLRRISHYDFWTDQVRRSVLLDSKATAVLYGMAERSLLFFARALADVPEPTPQALTDILLATPGAAFAVKRQELPSGAKLLELPSHEAILADPQKLITATMLLEGHVHQDSAIALQANGDRLVALTPPGPGLDTDGLDLLAGLPFGRKAHPCYTQPIPAVTMIEASITTHRGCAGGCSFCTLALHQGRRIRSRSPRSILAEAQRLAETPGFAGSITDMGGPSANMWGAACTADPAACARASCMTPAVCPHFSVDQGAYVNLLKAASRIKGIKHVRVASGWRMDLALDDQAAMEEMVARFVGGQAKVAPEHIAPHVLRLMRKPPFAVFEKFLRLFAEQSARAGKKQYLIPYLMSAFPGCTDPDMRAMADWLSAMGWKPNQVQCFIPLPGTLAAAMYHAETDAKGRPIFVAKSDAQRLRQHGLLAPAPRRQPGPHPNAPGAQTPPTRPLRPKRRKP